MHEQEVLTYKITIEKVYKVYVPEKDEKYFTKADLSPADWSAWHNDKENHIVRQLPTGEMELKVRSEKVYEQEKENLDIGELALFINRTR